MAEEDKKVQGATDDAPPPEAKPAVEEQRDPDEAVLAEQAILSYAHEALEQFRQQLESALEYVAGWANSQAGQLDGGAVGPELGRAFLQQMIEACGGVESPIGAALFDQLYSEVDSIVRDEQDAGQLVQNLASAGRDFTWYLRDNLQSVLSHEWDQLRDLAYEGETDFIPALHAYGLPRMDFSGAGLRDGLVAVGETTLQQKPKTEEEALARDPEQEQLEQQQALQEANEKSQASA